MVIFLKFIVERLIDNKKFLKNNNKLTLRIKLKIYGKVCWTGMTILEKGE